MKQSVLCLLLGLLQFVHAKQPPNIILIMTDDMGIECLGTYGSETYRTPHLDKLASRGMKFHHCYSQPLCTPSRVKIMTGRYNFRNYTKFKHLDPTQRTFGHVAKSAGYTTAVCGKWQLDGDETDDFGKKYGFDRYCLWYLNQKNFGSRYLHPKLVQDGKRIGKKGEYGPDLVNDFALQFIDSNKNKPFLLYYPMILPHYPFEPTPASKDWDSAAKKAKKNKKYYADMVSYLDQLVGKLITRLDQHQLTNNTLILFTSDNGTMRGIHSKWRGGIAYPGGKGRLDNSGCHVPLIATWPGTIKRGQTTEQLVDFSDFFATIQELTGGDGPKDYKIDGISFLPLLKGQTNYRGRSYTYCHYDPKWGTPETGQFARTQTHKVYGGGKVYHIAGDYFEKKPLKSIPPDAKEGIQALRKVIAAMKAAGSNPKEKFNRKPSKITPKKK